MSGRGGPAGRVTAIDANSFTVTASTFVGPTLAGMATTTLCLETRPLGSADEWSLQACAAAAVGIELEATGGAGRALEWRLVEREDVGTYVYDGTHGVTTPAASIWSTLTATVSEALEGQGLPASAIYVGTQPEPNYAEVVAVLRTKEERAAGAATNGAERFEYPVEVEFRVIATDPTGALQKPLVETWQRRLEAALHERHARDFPGIPGLEGVRVEISAKDTRGSRDNDDGSDELRARAVVRFAVWREK